MNAYRLNRWSNQENYVEVWIEKKALQGVFETPCRRADVGLAPCKGYPSLTFLNDAKDRFEEAIAKNALCGTNGVAQFLVQEVKKRRQLLAHVSLSSAAHLRIARNTRVGGSRRKRSTRPAATPWSQLGRAGHSEGHYSTRRPPLSRTRAGKA